MVYQPRFEPARKNLNAARADALLANLEANEELAAVWESEEIPELRFRFAAQYARVIGVEPALRVELRNELLRIRETGDCAVEEVIEHVRHSSRGSGVAGLVAPEV